MSSWFFALSFLFVSAAWSQESVPLLNDERPVRIGPSQDLEIENFAGEIHFEQNSATEKAEFSRHLGIHNSEEIETNQKFEFSDASVLELNYLPPADYSKITFVLLAGLPSDELTFRKTKENLQINGFGVLRIYSVPLASNAKALSSYSQHLLSVFDQLHIDKTKLALAAYSYGVALGAQVAFDLFEKQKIKVRTLCLIHLLTNEQKANADFASQFSLLKKSSQLNSLLGLFTIDDALLAPQLEEQFAELPIERRGVFTKFTAPNGFSDTLTVSDAISNFLEMATPL